MSNAILRQFFTTNVPNEVLLNTDMGELYKDVWVNNGVIIIPQLSAQLFAAGYYVPLIEMSVFDNAEAADLAAVFTSNQSDKSTYSNYHVLYSHIFNLLGKNSALHILEFGLDKRPGGSLYAFREYLPNANMCGTTDDSSRLFTDERIQTLLVDQYILSNFMAIPNALADVQFDLIIENGGASITTMLNTILFALNNLNKGGWIVVEDIHIVENWRCIDYMLNDTKLYETHLIRSDNAFTYAIHKLP